MASFGGVWLRSNWGLCVIDAVHWHCTQVAGRRANPVEAKERVSAFVTDLQVERFIKF